jgi:cytochrome c-type biogenesis protein CcmH
MSRSLALLAAALGLLAIAPPAGAAAPTLHDVEDEVMCPICGTLLELSEAPQAERQRVYIARLIAAGKNKAEIKDALVGQYGDEVLALPEDSGFDLAAYLLPVIALAVAIVVLAFSVGRWRRSGGDAGKPRSPAPRGEQAERLEQDLSRYDP